jgi:hypothetical protein
VPELGDPDGMYGPEDFAPKMRLAIAGRDDGRFPVELLHRRMVPYICDGGLPAPYDQRSAATAAACKARRERQEREMVEMEAAFSNDSDLLDADLRESRCSYPDGDMSDEDIAKLCDPPPEAAVPPPPRS